MKPFLSLLPIFLSLPLLSAESSPPATVTLDTLVTQALTENPELQFFESEIAATKGEGKAAGAWANPEIAGEFGRKRVRGDAAAEGAAWAISVQQTFEWPGRVSLRKAIADRQVQLAEAGLDQFRAALSAEVRRRAFSLFAAQNREDATREVTARGEELVATLVQREPAGVTPLLETRAIEASVIKLRREATESAQEAQSALYELNQLRGQPIEKPLRIADVQLTFEDLPGVDELIRRAARGNFTLRQREIELAQQGFKVRLSENEAWPSITIGPQISQEKAGEKETVAGVGITLPLPLWHRNSGNVEAAKARQLQAQTSLRMSQREVERKIREQAAAYDLHRKEMARWNPKVAEQLREAASLADRHYRLGAVPLATYLEVQSSYLEALEAIYATQADALNAQAELELLTGAKILKP
jgi:cobalt-zinc-cadmium efflux system outer membrane protein